MLPQKRLESLQKKSALIAQRIEQQERNPSFDTTTLRQLKKQKLEIKQVIEGIAEENSPRH